MRKFISISGIEYMQPVNVDEVKALVRNAKNEGQRLVVHGARHSFPLSEQPADNAVTYVMLTYMNKIIKSDWVEGIFTVQAGCHIGYDPSDETKVSTLQNSLVYQLDPLTDKGRRNGPPGWALPELGGITHQTIGGFIATGSSGGSIKYAFNDAIQSVRVIYYSSYGLKDETFTRPADNNPNDPFWAVGYAHLGLLGIVVEVTLACTEAYNVMGSEITSQTIGGNIDMMKNGLAFKNNITALLTSSDYSRMLWWPQKGINKVMLWKANRDIIIDWKNYKPKPYKNLPIINGSSALANRLFGGIFYFIGHVLVNLKNYIIKFFSNNDNDKTKIELWFTKLDIAILKIVLSVFARNGVKNFNDCWWRCLPMDNDVSDKFSPVKFTELWIPLIHAEDVLLSLQNFYTDAANAGNFCSELYCGKKNNFWLSPGYGNDMIRVDVFWFGRNVGDPVEYFDRFWRHLQNFNFRFHWGKYLGFIHPEETASYIQASCPRLNDFLELRKIHDPYNIFLNSYWQQHLGIP